MPSTTSIAVQTHATNKPPESVVCKLCRRQFSKYTCPTCNVPYCSLTCFRSGAHSQCSEPFYKKEIETGIHAEPSKTAQERSQMLEMLKRFEDENADTTRIEEEDDSEMSQRFSSINLESASADTLWTVLTPLEREKFLGAINDPSSDTAQNLLSSEELLGTLEEPWWELREIGGDPTTSQNQGRGEPDMMHIPDSMMIHIPNRPLLIYNLASICLAYAFIVRHLGVASFSGSACEDGDLKEAFRLLSQFLPFLLDRRSTLVYGGLSAVIAELWSRFDENTISPDILSALLWDSAHLMAPLNVIEGTERSNSLLLHPHQRPLLVLSDLAHLISVGLENGWVPQQSKHVSHKLVFYGAHVATMPTPLLWGIVRELEQKRKTFDEEAKTDSGPTHKNTSVRSTGPFVQEP